MSEVRRPGTWAAGAALVLLLSACGGEGSSGAQATPGETTGASEPSSPAAASPTGGEDPNPVVENDFPDPDALETDGAYYAYATNGNAKNVQLARSDDLQTWEMLPTDALPTLPSWVIPGKTWAPEVTEVAPGSYVMYATATNFQPTLQCIAVAASDSAEGPFEVVGEEMLVCPEDGGGAIDAATFVNDDGTRYLLWKNDGNCCGLDTWLWIAPLAPDGLTLAGEPTRLIKQDLPWEGDLIEAPTLVKRDGTYVLMYSANSYGGPEYTIGYATADAVTGPYTKNPEPLLSTEMTDGRYVGPGGQDVLTAPDGSDRLAFHSWYGGQTYRAMNVLPLEWEDGTPVVRLDNPS